MSNLLSVPLLPFAVTKTMKRVTEVTRFSLAEEVGFEPTVPVDTAVFELSLIHI